jgi:pyrimidine operon attenuation protein/uracil phosphoribosyltransferase
LIFLYVLQVHEFKTEIAYLEEHIEYLEKERMRSLEVKITFYAPDLSGINSDTTPDKTTTMQTPVPGWTCAISRDLVRAGWLGRRIYIKGVNLTDARARIGDMLLEGIWEQAVKKNAKLKFKKVK